MTAHQLCRDGKAQTGAPLARTALERSKQMLPRLGGKAGAVVADADHPVAGLFTGSNDDFAGFTRGDDRLSRVAHKIRQDPEQMLRIGAHVQILRHVAGERQVRPVDRQPLAINDVINDAQQWRDRQRRTWLFRAAEGKRGFAQVHGAGD